MGCILTHLGINWDYSMKFKFYKMKAWQEVYDCCGETSFRKLIIKRYKQHALSNLLDERLQFKVVQWVQRILLPIVFTSWRQVGAKKWVQGFFLFCFVFNICLFLNGDGWWWKWLSTQSCSVGKCFFYRLCLINHAFKWKHQKRNRIVDSELCN